ncbi:HAD family hydrolase [Candidatus Nitrosopumilus sediminis]|uniref:Hydrolase n=1 Tax=Candidatus Nitrosopumilus sediminis TaxID=1229909 RepID=K0BA73_9ARCH|nr:HAD hydrolase-like protein [Candidatus Nitrosopumilus sediminis]AFS81957.1 hydrolase [Candidatus Nitrosopumilus sediminis]
MTLRKKSDGIYVDDSKIEILNKIDAVVFDCDGVLIDITKSYDLAIIKTTQYVLEHFAKIDDSIPIDFKIIDGFKSTGGFNDEVDLTYAAIISIVAAKKLEKDQTKFVYDVIENSDSTGIISVEKYIENLVDISDIKKQLSYPGTHHENPLYRIFDQIFYGPELYEKLFHNTSNFSDPGLIEQDDVILNDILIEKLLKKFNSKIAMVTGRGKESVSYSLKSLLNKFDLNNSVFLEDESRELAKPNPQPLLNSINGMNSTSTLYVGDSFEDFIMAKKTTGLGHETTFCGIIGTSKNPQEKLRLFEKNDAILVLDSIHLLPKVLNLE